LDNLGGCKTVASDEIIAQSHSYLWLMVWVLVFVREFNMQFLGERLIRMGLDT
jgi:hypothetical protein